MKILIYGFGPYREFADNITEKILGLLPPTPDLETKVFDVRFDREMFEHVFDRIKPDVIVGLGQYPRAGEVRNERLARDIRSDDGNQKGSIVGEGDLRMSLELPDHPQLIASEDAGDYVCNFSMYIAESYARREGIKAGFLHIPRDIDASSAVSLLPDLLNWIRKSLASNFGMQ